MGILSSCVSYVVIFLSGAFFTDAFDQSLIYLLRPTLLMTTIWLFTAIQCKLLRWTGWIWMCICSYLQTADVLILQFQLSSQLWQFYIILCVFAFQRYCDLPEIRQLRKSDPYIQTIAELEDGAASQADSESECPCGRVGLCGDGGSLFSGRHAHGTRTQIIIIIIIIITIWEGGCQKLERAS